MQTKSEIIDCVRSGWLEGMVYGPSAASTMTSSQIFSGPARHNSVDDFFIIPPLSCLVLLKNFGNIPLNAPYLILRFKFVAVHT